MADEFYFDSGVFVTPILKNRSGAVIRSCLNWQMRIERGEVNAFTSWLTWDEVVWVAGRARGPFDTSYAASVGAAFSSLPNLKFLDVDGATIERAQALFAGHRLRPRDSIHASSSLIHADGNFVTLDADFRTRATAIGLKLYEIAD